LTTPFETANIATNGWLGTQTKEEQNMTASLIGLQLYSVRGECKADLPATLKAVADIGYVGVEPYGYGGDTMVWEGHEAADIRSMLDDLGLIIEIF